MPTLETPRLVLRPFTATAWDAVDAMLSDVETTRHMHFGTWTAARRREWFDWCVAEAQRPAADSIDWAIARRDTGETIGWFGIGAASEPTIAEDISFGYLLARSHWNRGYMTEALRAVFAYEFETLGVPRLSATCEVDNAASARVMEKAGMRRERTVHGADFEGNLALRHHYRITSVEYESGNERAADTCPSRS